MRFSVLLPTRNGGSRLKMSLSSILSQRFNDFELVVADNANTDDTPTVLDSFAVDPRLRVVRSSRVLSVTENWSVALDAALGDYILMIGDDDCLMPRFFERVQALLARYSDPDCLTFNAFTYVERGALGPASPAYFAPRHFSYALGHDQELDRARRRELVADMFRFRVRFPLNIQLTLFAKRMVGRIPGAFFRPPFPDHFALNSLLLLADRFVSVSDQLVVVGLSAKSFGHYFYSGRQDDGLSYLGSDAQFEGRLDGSELLNCMHVWLEELRTEYARELAGVRISRWQYAARQVYNWFRELDAGYITRRLFLRRTRQLRPPELVTVLLPVALYRIARSAQREVSGARERYIQDIWPGLQPLPGDLSILEFAAAMDSHAATTS